MKTDEELVAELRGRLCQCGKSKSPRQTFCRACYFSLPHWQRKALHQRLGSGYDEAYDEASKTLGK